MKNKTLSMGAFSKTTQLASVLVIPLLTLPLTIFPLSTMAANTVNQKNTSLSDFEFSASTEPANQSFQVNPKKTVIKSAPFVSGRSAQSAGKSIRFKARNDYKINLARSKHSGEMKSKPNSTKFNLGVTQVNSSGNVIAFKNTALNYRYSGDWNRCWMEPAGNSNAKLNTILDNLNLSPDYIMIVLNENSGGGCRRGNQLAVTLSSQWTTVSHEMGRMVGGLCDEYIRGGGAAGVYAGAEPTCTNLTTNTNSATTKWRDFNGDGYSDVVIPNNNSIALYSANGNNLATTNVQNNKLVGATSWQMKPGDKYLVGGFDGDGKDDLFVFNSNWFGMLRSNSTTVNQVAIHNKWIHDHQYHRLNWW